MVLDYYQLREQPFGVTPDSRYLFLSGTHREALASLLYGVDAGCGFLALIAAPGLGKTTLLFHVLNQLREKARTVFLFQTVCTPLDLLRALLTGLGVQETQGSLIQMQSRLKDVLVEQARLGKRVVVVIDEAQNLDDSVLELVRMLSNFETAREKLIQIILSGQSQLAEKMASPELEQLRQRVSIFSHLKPFSPEDTELYIAHRLRIAGCTFEAPFFTRDALALISDYSNGIPRNVNNLCFNSLALGCALQRKPIDRAVVLDVIDDLDFGRLAKKPTLAGRVPAQERRSREAPSFSTAKRDALGSRARCRNLPLAWRLFLWWGRFCLWAADGRRKRLRLCMRRMWSRRQLQSTRNKGRRRRPRWRLPRRSRAWPSRHQLLLHHHRLPSQRRSKPTLQTR